MLCEVIATGGSGNAVLVNGTFLFDCGVPFFKIMPYYKQISLVFLTHRHSDHFKIQTIRRLFLSRPCIRFVCSRNVLTDLVCLAKIPLENVILVTPEKSPKIITGSRFGETVEASSFDLIHDVENVGWVIKVRGGEEDGSAMYATDTHHIPCSWPGLDLYMIEGNYRQEDIERRIAAKTEAGAFSYEGRVLESHMSMERAVEWLQENADPVHSRIVFLHGHVEKEEVEDGLDRTAPGTERTQENVQVCGGPEH